MDTNHNFIHNTLLTVQYSKDVASALSREMGHNISGTIRKRCRALLAKMKSPKMGSRAIAKFTGAVRNFVDKVIHPYNESGLQDVLIIEEKGNRPNRLADQWETVAEALTDGVPRRAKEAVNIIQKISGHEFSLIWARVLMKDIRALLT